MVTSVDSSGCRVFSTYSRVLKLYGTYNVTLKNFYGPSIVCMASDGSLFTETQPFEQAAKITQIHLTFYRLLAVPYGAFGVYSKFVIRLFCTFAVREEGTSMEYCSLRSTRRQYYTD